MSLYSTLIPRPKSACQCVSVFLRLCSWCLGLWSWLISPWLPLYPCVSMCHCVSCSLCSYMWISWHICLVVCMLLCLGVFIVVIARLSLGKFLFVFLCLCDRDSTSKCTSKWVYRSPAREHLFLCVYVPDAVTLASYSPLCMPMCPYAHSLFWDPCALFFWMSLSHYFSVYVCVLLAVFLCVTLCLCECVYVCVYCCITASLLIDRFIHSFSKYLLSAIY